MRSTRRKVTQLLNLFGRLEQDGNRYLRVSSGLAVALLTR